LHAKLALAAHTCANAWGFIALPSPAVTAHVQPAALQLPPAEEYLVGKCESDFQLSLTRWFGTVAAVFRKCSHASPFAAGNLLLLVGIALHISLIGLLRALAAFRGTPLPPGQRFIDGPHAAAPEPLWLLHLVLGALRAVFLGVFELPLRLMQLSLQLLQTPAGLVGCFVSVS
jgi:hypothetical protein